MEEKIEPVAVDDLVAASAIGVLRAISAREEGNVNAVELVKNGFFVDIHIIAGGIWGPWLDRLPGRFGGIGLGDSAEQ